jgi:hypothetical protein
MYLTVGTITATESFDDGENVMTSGEEESSEFMSAGTTIVNTISGTVIAFTTDGTFTPTSTFTETRFDTPSATESETPTPVVRCPASQEDCSGRCPNIDEGYGYNIDCRGLCVSPTNFKVHDNCGVCNGNSDTCLDCTGVVNGTVIVDACGFCGGDGSICSLVVGIEPDVIPNKPGTNFTIYGAGFTVETVVSINQVVIPADNLDFLPSQYIIVTIDSALITLIGGLQADIKEFTVVVDGGSVLIWIYDPVTNFINSIGPIVNQIDTPNVLTVTGGFVATGGNMSCIFEDGSELGISGPATLISSQEITCNSPGFSRSGVINVHVVYSLPMHPTPFFSVNNMLRTMYYLDGNLEIQVWEEAPVGIAVFEGNGAKISVLFDEDVFVIDSAAFEDTGDIQPLDFSAQIDCSALFQAGDLYTEESNTCILTQPTKNKVVMTLAYDSSRIVPGDVLIFSPSSIVKQNCEFCNTASGGIVVNAPVDIVQPLVVVNGPSVIGSCGDLVLDVSLTTGQLGRPWKGVSITIESNELLIDASNPLLVDLVTRTNSEITIISTQIPIGATYTFTFTYENYLGGKGSGDIAVQKVADEIPSVTVYSANAVIYVENIQYIHARADLNCAGTDGKNILFNWAAVGNDLLPVDIDGASLKFLPYSFQPNKEYTFEVTYGYEGEASFTTSYVFTTAPDKTYTSAGPSRTIGIENTFGIYPVIQNSAYRTINLDSYDAEYFCTTYPEKGSCGSVVFGNSATGYDLTGMLGIGSYLFGVKVTNTETGTITTSSNSLVEVVDGTVPVVFIDSSYLFAGHRQRINVKASVAEVSGASYQWSSVEFCSGERSSLIDLVDVAATPTDLSELELKIGSVPPGSSICLQVSVLDASTTRIGTSSVKITIDDIPSSGTCIATPTSVSTDEAVTIQCMGYVSSTTLKYEFGIRPLGETTKYTLLGPMQGSSALVVELLEGIWEVRVIIYDGTYAMNADPVVLGVDVEAGLTRRGLSNDAFTAYLDGCRNRYIATKDIVTAWLHLGVALAQLPSDTAGFQFASAVLDFGEVISDSWILDQNETPRFVASYISSVIGMVYKHEVVNAMRIFGAVEGFAEGFNGVDTGCYENGVSSAFYGAVDGVLASLNSASIHSPTISGRYEKLMKSLRSCRYTSLSCVGSPFTFTGEALSLSIGRRYTDNEFSICDTISVNGFASTSVSWTDCVEYECRTDEPINVLVNPDVVTGVYNGIGKASTSFGFSSNSTALSLRSTVITGYITDASFAASFNIFKYVSGLSGGGQRPILAFINEDYTTIDTENVILTSIDIDKYHYEAYATGNLAIFAVDFEWVCVGFDNCNGICPGETGFADWDIDCSGNCTRVDSADFKIPDVCGVCDGLRSCVDCKDVVNGIMRIDVCGACSDPANTPSCFIVTGTEPSIIPNVIGTVFTLYGAGFTDETEFRLNGEKLGSDSVFVNGNQIVTITLIKTLPGTEGDVSNVVISAVKGFEQGKSDILYYDPSETQIESVGPSKVFADDEMVCGNDN